MGGSAFAAHFAVHAGITPTQCNVARDNFSALVNFPPYGVTVRISATMAQRKVIQEKNGRAGEIGVVTAAAW